MATVVSTGQFTITDHNDAAPITSFIDASKRFSQVITNNDGSNSYNPDWSVSPYQVLTVHVYVGSADVASQLTNRKWSYDSLEGTSQGSGTSLTINSNVLTEASPVRTYYFQGDYTDPITGITTHVVCSQTFTAVKKGDSAIYVMITGKTAIQKSATATAATCEIQAGLYRNAGERDTTNVSYKWYKIVGGTAQALVSGHPDVTSNNIRFKNDAGTVQSAPTDFSASCTTIEINEKAVQDIQLFKAEVKDTNTNTVYGSTFIVYDVSDPYDVKISSSAGDKFQNGIGTTNLTPEVRNGASLIDVTGWTFVWTMYNKDGDRQGFVNTTVTPAARTISGNTTSAFTVSSGISAAASAGQLVKVCKSDGSQLRFYEISAAASSGATTISIRTSGLTNVWASTVAPVANEYNGGKLFVCDASKNTNGDAAITITGDDVDVKGTIFCEASKPI